MKKTISLLLCVLMIFSFAACNEESIDESSINESVSTESTDESIVLDDFVLSEDVAKIDSYLKNDIDRTLLATNVFRSMQYKISRPTDPAYPDNSYKLTNGASIDSFEKNYYR